MEQGPSGMTLGTNTDMLTSESSAVLPQKQDLAARIPSEPFLCPGSCSQCGEILTPLHGMFLNATNEFKASQCESGM